MVKTATLSQLTVENMFQSVQMYYTYSGQELHCIMGAKRKKRRRWFKRNEQPMWAVSRHSVFLHPRMYILVAGGEDYFLEWQTLVPPVVSNMTTLL